MQSEATKQEEIEALAREMAKEVKTEADLEAVTRTLTKTLIETALKAEMTDHLSYEAGDPDGPNFVIHTRKGRGISDATTKEGEKTGRPRRRRLSERSPGESHTCHRAVGWTADEPAPYLTNTMKCGNHSAREIRASRHIRCTIRGV